MARHEDIQKAFLNGEYSFTLNKVHTTDSKISVHEVMAPEENKEVYDFVIRAISTYGAEECPLQGKPPKFRYCPDCGAKMDVKENEERPTPEQITCATCLAQRMFVELPTECTKEAYSAFIDKWEPLAIQEDMARLGPSEWRSVSPEDMAVNEQTGWQWQY